jgi:hypothetical protein
MPSRDRLSEDAHEPVGRKSYEQATERLRRRGDLDVDALLAEDPETLLGRPLGPTPACLSIGEVADFLEPDRDARLGAERVAAIQVHLTECDVCRADAELYQRFVSSAEARARAAATHGPIHLVESRIDDPVDIDANDPENVTLTVVMRSRGAEAPVEPRSLHVRGALRGRSRSLRRLAATTTATDDPEREVAYEVNLEVEPVALPRLEEAPVLDWLKLEGELEDGGTFSTRSLVHLRQAIAG